jgi:hypothetical protein
MKYLISYNDGTEEVAYSLKQANKKIKDKFNMFSVVRKTSSTLILYYSDTTSLAFDLTGDDALAIIKLY